MYQLETTKHYMYTGTATICFANIENHTVTMAVLTRKFNNKSQPEHLHIPTQSTSREKQGHATHTVLHKQDHAP